MFPDCPFPCDYDLDYGDAMFDKAYNNSFQQRLESFQYKASLVITDAIKSSSTEKLYQELELEYLQNRRWFRKLCVFYKIVTEHSSNYLFGYIPSNSNSYLTRKCQNLVISQFNVGNNFFFNSFFASTLVEWNKLD